MELFFTEGELRRPFILDSQMRWPQAVNHFLRDVVVINGKTASPHTWRAYAYHLLDFLNFCERVGQDWSEVLEIHLAEYRNALLTTASPLTKRRLARETINGRLGTVCVFYKFALRKGYVAQLPFSYNEVRVIRNRDEDMLAHVHARSGKVEVNRLMLRTYDSELELPPNKEIGRFLGNFGGWRDKLMAQAMWLTGMRREEVCKLTVHLLPDDPQSLTGKTHKLRIQGKGGKWRSIYFPVNLLRSVTRYVELERNPRVLRHKVKTDQIWVSDKGQPISPVAVDKAFATNAARCRVKITPHDLRRSYATNRLIYLEDYDVPSPYKIVQYELGHAHLSTTFKYIRYVERMRAEVVALHANFIDRLVSEITQDEED
jgi:site-specific recombinase XerD